MKHQINLFLFCAISLLFGCKNQKSDAVETETTDSTEVMKTTDYTEAIQGAWTTSYTNENGEDVTITTIVMDGYIAETFYNKEAKRFDGALGGSWTIDGNTFNLTFEFDTTDSTMVGQTAGLVFNMSGDTITFEGDDKIWNRIDDGKPGALAGAYLITGRKQDGEISKRTPGVRKTMKILSGTRFQWIAYNTETTKFSGTGGGTYTARDGEYVETIEFFSKDGSRVGAVLPFNYEIVDGEWHHSGLSSKGDPIYEIWTPRSILDAAKAQ
ncbi:membrane or secreted protein [Reichenbachiella sp. MALMAid0571]|uniref:membrane or secreted protein n=1 Tax=Reichenbachiella sp. MALMAid0571 TaxID=3143939 RepID=UPI0032DE9046